MAQLKKLTFKELKFEFEKLMKSIERFVPMGSKERVKRQGVQLEHETSKKQKIVVEDVPTAHHEVEEDMEALVKGNDTGSSSGKKGVYQIIREDGTYTTYINFGAMLKSISRDDLTELYRLVMQRYGTNGPVDEYERCLTLESADIYMLTERRYPLPDDVCQAMLDKKLQGEAVMEMGMLFECWFNHHTKNGHQLTMSNRHQELASPKQTALLATPEQTATGKEISNPLIADSLLKAIRSSSKRRLKKCLDTILKSLNGRKLKKLEVNK
ncbi:hypothetical protein Tco_1351027 [Tanacetum coccineum]